MRECKTPGFCNCMSSLIAKQRLRDVIKQDRQAVPCGRWVQTKRSIRQMESWLCVAYGVKLRFRWEQRR